VITLITGQPGAGKTLLTLDDLRKVQGREIYYSGIPDLKLPWIELDDPEKWHECPDGSIIVIDEAQRVFRPRGNGAQVPEHVAKLETHRHKGHDLYVITQHPMLVDSNLRRLVGLHRHVMRAFGSRVANVHEWQEVNQQPDRTRKDSQVRVRHYPKDVFNLYKSAEVHTHKMRLPPRLLALLLVPVVLAASVYFVWQWQSEQSAPGATADKENAQEIDPNIRPDSVPTVQAAYNPASFIPRVVGIQESAPRYDELTTPKRAPQLAGCISSKTRCQCYMPDGSRYQTTEDLCRLVVANGVPFVDWIEPDRDVERPGRASEARGLDAPPSAPLETLPREAGEIVNLERPAMSIQTALALRAMAQSTPPLQNLGQ
jgi:zona occludens toxin